MSLPAFRSYRLFALPALWRRPVILAIACLAAGCTTLGGNDRCESETDPVTRAQYRWCGEVERTGDDQPLRLEGDIIRLVPVQMRLGDDESYFVRVVFQGQRWLYIAPGSELRLTLDGQTFDLVSTAGSRPDSTRQIRERYSVGVQEAADFRTDAGVLRAIGNARLVEARFQATPERVLESRLTGPSLQPFRDFVRVYLGD